MTNYNDVISKLHCFQQTKRCDQHVPTRKVNYCFQQTKRCDQHVSTGKVNYIVSDIQNDVINTFPMGR
jgi:hypothetical protein